MFLSPEQTIKNIELEHGMIVADFGSGSGHYTVSAAKLVGPSGNVYSIDVQKEMLQTVKSRCDSYGLNNVKIIWADLELENGSHLADGIVDVVIISNILFQAENKKAILDETFRVLKIGGKVAVIEWEISDDKVGPHVDKRIKPDEVEKIFTEAGFTKERDFEAAEKHYGMIFRKKAKNRAQI